MACIEFNRRTLFRVLIALALVSFVWLPQLRGGVSFYETNAERVTPRVHTSLHNHEPRKQTHLLNNTNALRSSNKKQNQQPFKLLKSDSIYHHYNMSTTPIVLPDHKLLLFTCEKVGSTVLRQLARRMMGFENYDYHGEGIPHVIGINGLKYLHQYSLEEAEEMLVSDEWTRAMFVRDPKERALSGYLMWKPHPPTRIQLEKAKRGQIYESPIDNKGKPGMLARCCKNIANGDYNFEVLCLNHMNTFDGFLDMIESPKTIDLAALTREYKAIPEDERNATVTQKFLLRNSPSCPDKHWSPITHWRMEKKFYPQLNFIGHLETAQWDIHRLLNRIGPTAWEEFGLSGWGEYRNESMFQSSSTVLHAKGTGDKLLKYYTSVEIEKRVEHIFKDDYENEYLELDRVKIGEASEYYRERFTERYLHSDEKVDI